MRVHLQREIAGLKKEILTISAMAEVSVREAAWAVERRDEALARRVIEKDIKIDQMEVEVEEACLKILALHQPVAIDLRFIIAVLKINNDLERIGDLAVNIAERAAFIATQPKVHISFDFAYMARKTQEMLNKSLDALVNLNVKLARKVCACDDEVDAMYCQVYQIIQEAIEAEPEQIETLIQLLSTARHLERIADHATNIAEDVIYMIEGEIVRHKTEEFKPHIYH